MSSVAKKWVTVGELQDALKGKFPEDDVLVYDLKGNEHKVCDVYVEDGFLCLDIDRNIE